MTTHTEEPQTRTCVTHYTVSESHIFLQLWCHYEATYFVKHVTEYNSHMHSKIPMKCSQIIVLQPKIGNRSVAVSISLVGGFDGGTSVDLSDWTNLIGLRKPLKYSV